MEPIENTEPIKLTTKESGTPVYFVLDRRIIGSMDAAKRVIETTAAASTFSHYPWIAFLLIGLRVAFSGIIAFSKVKNPVSKD